ncbi:MAG: outer membrane lipoprotein-sorting protein [Candidatus Omnitrophica bacterium]|nr:outer membrane lipoprotein-sorting protein [Candidatus Omnitrophota bacterium]
MRRIIFFILILLLMSSFAYAQKKLEYFKLYSPKEGMSAEEIMQIKYFNKYSLFANDFQQSGEVFYVEPNGNQRKRNWQRKRITKAGKDGIAYKDMIVMTYPTEVKGLAVLTWTYEDPNKEQDTWLWIPSLKKSRKVSASNADDSFMGSDFTVEEVSTRRFEDETYKLLEEKTFEGYKFDLTGEMKMVNRPCFVIECIPKRAYWYYSKRIVWVDKELGGAIFEEYYDRNGKLFKTLFREWKWIDISSARKYPTQQSLVCKDIRTGHYTVITMKDTKYDQGLDERLFTVEAISQSRW